MKSIVGIFAHPDDEALGPSGTLATLAKENDVYLVCVTSGEAAGKTPEEKLTIGEIRRKELQKSASYLGIKEVFFLGYEDGELKNNLYHALASDIAKKVEELRPETLVTYEQRGVSGHIDHIAVSMVTTFVFYQYSFIKKLLYYCNSKEKSDKMKEYFIYFPQGYERDEVDKVVDVTDVWETKVKAMLCHQSQIADVQRVLKESEGETKEEYFLVMSKDE